ncbi:DUF4157 domain-containing protein [Flavobacterium sp. N1736]|uniref:eCIS core domain-containing protein n=1 Tax=Flavobacterium sp. N1736 TaxID=2986823 RepID=UPI00222427A3|nr:DUF4157 domain-containing protein [Flavobacterium sp. N1736]
MRAFEQRKKNSPSDSSFFAPKIQKKLKTGTPGDQFEVEADRVADKVVNNNASGSGLLQSKEALQQKPISETITSVQSKDMKEEEPVQKKSDKEEEKPVQKKEKEEEKPVQKKEDKKEEEKPVQAKCAECEKEEKAQKKEEKEEDKAVQKKEQNSESEVENNKLEEKLDNSKGNGAGLDKKTKGEMESGFGTDFSNVKIHTDTNAVQMSQDLGAQAFTNGNDVYFNKGKYNPDSREGKHLLAHELTHTIQQTGAKQKSGTIQKSLENHPEDLQAEGPDNPQFKGNTNLEKANDDEMLISTGQKGIAVRELQKGLMETGQNLNNFGADGDFGSETRNAVIDFQNKNDLATDGVVGPETIGTLDNKLIEQKGGGLDNCCGEAFQLPQNDNEFKINDTVLSQSTFCSKGNFKITSTAKWLKPNKEPHYLLSITAIQGGTVNVPDRRFDVGRSETQSFAVTSKDCIFFKVEIKVINPGNSPTLKGKFSVTN